jgi:5-methylcytosine-specific restriction endonuclease McrA
VPRIISCPGCGKEELHHSKGFCHRCYNKFIWANNPKKKEYDGMYYLENKEQIKKRISEYNQTLAGKLVKRKNYYSRGGKDQYDPREVKMAIYFNFFKYGGHYCENCKKFLGDSHDWSYQVDHIHALTRGGATEFDNLQILCQPCNLSKRGKTIDYRFRELNA